MKKDSSGWREALKAEEAGMKLMELNDESPKRWVGGGCGGGILGEKVGRHALEYNWKRNKKKTAQQLKSN